MAENITRLSNHIKAQLLTIFCGENWKTILLVVYWNIFYWLAAWERNFSMTVFFALKQCPPPHGLSSYTRYGSVSDIFHRHKYHPLGPLRVKIISFLMWIPLWGKLPRMGALSQHHLLVVAGFSLPLLMRMPPPPALTFRPLAVEARVRVWAIAQRKWFRTLQAKKRRKKSISITLRWKPCHHGCELELFALGLLSLYCESHRK